MANKDDKIEMMGTVIDVGRNAVFRILMENDSVVLAKLCGRMVTRRIRVIHGDKVKVEISGYDTSRGRIIYREK